MSFISVSPNSLRIDRLKIYITQTLWNNGFPSTQEFMETMGEDNFRTSSDKTVWHYRANDRIFLRHYLFMNGNNELRAKMNLVEPYSSISSCDGNSNFIPILPKGPNSADILFNDLPHKISQACELALNHIAVFANKTLQSKGLSDKWECRAFQGRRTFSLASIEGGVDVIVPADHDLEKNHNFLENLKAIGNFDEPYYLPNKSNCKSEISPEETFNIDGTLYNFGSSNYCKIYLKDTSHPKFWIIRFEMRPSGYAFNKMLGGKLFSINPYSQNYIGTKIENFLNDFVLPIAEHIFDVQMPAESVAARINVSGS